jgi:hypothetical protein
MSAILRKEKRILGTPMEYHLTRRFIEEVNTLLKGSGKETAEMVVNTLGGRNEIFDANIGQRFNINIQNTLKITGIKDTYDEVTFISMVKF